MKLPKQNEIGSINKTTKKEENKTEIIHYRQSQSTTDSDSICTAWKLRSTKREMVYLFGVVDNTRCVGHFGFSDQIDQGKPSRWKSPTKVDSLARRRTGWDAKVAPVWLGGQIELSRLVPERRRSYRLIISVVFFFFPKQI